MAPKHSNHKSTLTTELTNLLEYFEPPEDDNMITYIGPEKHKHKHNISTKPSRNGTHSNDNGYDRNDRTFNSSLNRIKTEEITPMPKSDPITTTAIVRVDNSIDDKSYKNLVSNKDDNNGVIKLVGGRYRSHSKHHFTKINASSFVSCSSSQGLYSEIAFILWVDSKSYKYQSDKYRIVLSLMFDAEEELWSISAKIIKRSTYSTKDEEEGQINNRLCMTSELRSEIKKMLLYLGVSPRQAYRLFRKNILEHCVISHSEYGFITVECASHIKLMKELDKPYSSSSHQTQHWDYHNNYCHGNYMPSAHLRQDRDKYKEAMMGYEDCYS